MSTLLAGKKPSSCKLCSVVQSNSTPGDGPGACRLLPGDVSDVSSGGATDLRSATGGLGLSARGDEVMRSHGSLLVSHPKVPGLEQFEMETLNIYILRVPIFSRLRQAWLSRTWTLRRPRVLLGSAFSNDQCSDMF